LDAAAWIAAMMIDLGLSVPWSLVPLFPSCRGPYPRFIGGSEENMRIRLNPRGGAFRAKCEKLEVNEGLKLLRSARPTF